MAKPWKNPAPLPDGVWVEPRSDGHWTAPLVLAWWEPDIDFLFGVGFTRTGWGFRKYPWASLHAATVSYSTGEKKFKGQYAGQYRLNDERLVFRTDLLASGSEHVNFFGLGNDTTNIDKAFSRTQQNLVSFFPSLRVGSSRTFEAFLGPAAKWVSAPTDIDTILNQQQPTLPKNQVGRGLNVSTIFGTTDANGNIATERSKSVTLIFLSFRASSSFLLYDAGKKTKGIKRDVLVDTIGLLLGIEVLPASVQDRDCAAPLIRTARRSFPFITHVFAVGGYASRKLEADLARLGVTIEIVKRMDQDGGF